MATSSLFIKSFQVSTLATAMALAGCGGGGNDTLQPEIKNTGTTTAPSTTPVDTKTADAIAKVKSISITSSASTFTATSGTVIPITIQAVDAGNLPVEGAPLNIVLPNPNATGLNSDNATTTTDASGRVQLKLTVAGNLTDAQKQALLSGITVKASVGSATNAITLTGTGNTVAQTNVSNIYLSPSVTAIESNSTFTVTAQALDNYNGGVVNTPITFSIPNPSLTGVNISSVATVNSDDKGEATVTFKVGALTDAQKAAIANGMIISASAGGKTNSITLKGAATGTTVNKTDKYNVFVSASKTALRSGNDSATLTVQVTDKQGGVAPDGTSVIISIADAAKYGLSLDKGSVLKTQGGKVTVNLLQSNIGILSQLDHTAKLDIKAFDDTSTVATTSLTMDVNGAAVKNLVASKYLVTANDSVNVTGTLVDGTDLPLSSNGTTVTLLNNGTSTGLTTTLNQGKFSFDVPVQNLTPDSTGKYNLTVQLNGNGATQLFSDSLSIKASTANANTATISYADNGSVATGSDIPANVGSRTVTVQLPSTYKAGSPVYVSATKALINGQSGRQQVAVSGNTATFQIQSSVTGSDKLTVEYNVVNNGVTSTTTVEDSINFVSISPAKLSLQVEKTVVSPTGSTNVYAKVLDANDAPVKNALVNFTTKQDASGGQLSSATAMTDASGIATVVYSAGSNPAPKVDIAATVNKIMINNVETQIATPLSSLISLTVQSTSSFIGLGFSDKLTSSTDNVYYFRNGSIYVNNSVGQPAANQPVSISITPTKYFAGEFKVLDSYANSNLVGYLTWLQAHTSTVGAVIGAPYYNRTWDATTGSYTYNLVVPNGVAGPLECKAEDDNTNGFMDTGEDRNGNNQLDPINPVTILSASGQAMGTGSATMMTDSSGKLDFQVRYPKETANWFEANVKISTKVDGTESVQTRGLDFPTMAEDVEISLNNPRRPNWVSPFAYRQVGVLGSNGYCVKPN